MVRRIPVAVTLRGNVKPGPQMTVFGGQESASDRPYPASEHKHDGRTGCDTR